jgi:hypothetical protein
MPRDMLIPLAIGLPLMVVAAVLTAVLDWSNGALGTILVLLAIGMSALGAALYPREGR